MSEIKAWSSVAQQLDKMNVDVANVTAANISESAGDVFFVGRPNQDGQTWTLKKMTPTELEKMVYNYLTSSSIAAQLATVLGAIEFIDIYQKDFNIDTLVVDGVSYSGQNVRMCLTEQTTHTWDGTFPIGLNTTGAEILSLMKRGYGIQQFFAQNGYALRVNFGSWKSWVVLKP